MSARTAREDSASGATAPAPISAAKARARSKLRLAASTVPAPREMNACAVLRPASPVPTTSTTQRDKSPKTRDASSTATFPTLTCPAAMPVFARAHFAA